MRGIWRDAIIGASILALGALLGICHLQKTIGNPLHMDLLSLLEKSFLKYQ